MFSFYCLNICILITLVGAALYFDLTKKRIPNFLTLPVIGWGIVSYTVTGGLSGLWFCFLGLLVGIAIFFIPFAMGGMGGGDVKLMGAIGALQGWQFVLSVALLAALAGGIMALAYLIFTGRLLRVLKKMVGFVLAPFFSFLYCRNPLQFFNRASIYFATQEREDQEPVRMPYGVAIATGVLIVLIMNLSSWDGHPLSSLPW